MNKSFISLKEKLETERGLKHVDFLTKFKYLPEDIDLCAFSAEYTSVKETVNYIRISGISIEGSDEYKQVMRKKRELDVTMNNIMKEITENFWFFLSEVVYVPDSIQMISNPFVLDDRQHYEYVEVGEQLNHKYVLHMWDLMFFWQLHHELHPIVMVPKGVNIHLAYAILWIYAGITHNNFFMMTSHMNELTSKMDYAIVHTYFKMVINAIATTLPCLQAMCTEVLYNENMDSPTSYCISYIKEKPTMSEDVDGFFLYAPSCAKLYTLQNMEARSLANYFAKHVEPKGTFGGCVYSYIGTAEATDYMKMDVTEHLLDFSDEQLEQMQRSAPEMFKHHTFFPTNVEDLLDTDVQKQYYDTVRERLNYDFQEYKKNELDYGYYKN